jgi:hypothetical protein
LALADFVVGRGGVDSVGGRTGIIVKAGVDLANIGVDMAPRWFMYTRCCRGGREAVWLSLGRSKVIRVDSSTAKVHSSTLGTGFRLIL